MIPSTPVRMKTPDAPYKPHWKHGIYEQVQMQPLDDQKIHMRSTLARMQKKEDVKIK